VDSAILHLQNEKTYSKSRRCIICKENSCGNTLVGSDGGGGGDGEIIEIGG
jgi:hypothetical protein